MENNQSIKSHFAFERVHLGKNGTVQLKDIVGIFDLDSSTESEITKDFLKRSEKEYKITNLLYDLPKSFVVTTYGDMENIYMLSNSVETEIKRMGENK
jgi:hypothetical protein